MQKSENSSNAGPSSMNVTQATQDVSDSKKPRVLLDGTPALAEGISSATAPHLTDTATLAQFDINQLPVELVQEIIANVDSTSDLCNICLVCKQFHFWVTQRLYESVFLSSTEQIIQFSESLSHKPSFGPIVRDLWMFISMMRSHTSDLVPAEDDDSDDGEWIPDVADGASDGSSSGSTPEGSSLDTETEDSYSEFDDLNVPVRLPPLGSQGYPHKILAFPHESTQSGPSSPPSSDRYGVHDIVHAGVKPWMRLLYPMVSPESLLYGHACTIMRACPSLRSLYLPWSSIPVDVCLHALLPSTQLQELAIFRTSDLRLTYENFESAETLMDLSTVQRLTIFDTTFQKLPTRLPDMFPVLTHLRISLNVSDGMVTCLSRFNRLTHLWFAPPEGDWHPEVDMETFLHDLQTQCPRIRRVRVDIPLGSYDTLHSFGAANWELFPFVRVKNSILRDTKSMWVYDLEYPFRGPPARDSSPDMFNAYADCLRHYWTLRLTGGGWED